MADARLEAALASARERYAAIAEGDTDAFELTMGRHEATCAAVAGVVERAADEDIHALNELIALEQQTLAEVGRVIAETGARVATLRAGGRTTAAYRPA